MIMEEHLTWVKYFVFLKTFGSNPTPPIDKWMSKMYHPRMEYCSSLKRNGDLTHATTGMDLEDMMPRVIRQSQKDKA